MKLYKNMKNEDLENLFDENREEKPITKKQQFISVVVYVHNDRDRIVDFAKTVVRTCQAHFYKCDFVFVDDFSTDDSVVMIKKYFAKNHANSVVTFLRMGRYHGMESAMNAGREVAIGDYVYEFDDLYIDYEPEVIIETFEKCIEGNDIVATSTKVPIRRTSKLYYKAINKLMGLKKGKIGQETFRILSRRGISRITAMDVNIPYRKIVYHNSGLPSEKIDYKSLTGKRPPRKTKKFERLNLAMDSFIYFTDIAQRVARSIVIFFALLSVFTMGYAIVSRAMGYHVGMGWLSTMLFLSFGLMGVFILLDLIIKYQVVIVDLTFKSQKYLIADIEKISFNSDDEESTDQELSDE